MATVILAASSRPGYQEHKLDFFLMHALTSVIFLPSLVEVLKPASRIALLYSHLQVSDHFSSAFTNAHPTLARS